jgi:hypothetical protein
MTDEHEQLADAAERDIEDLEEKTDELGGEIAELKSDDYEDKLKDEIEGAIGDDPDETESPAPEATEPPGDDN